MSDPLTKENQLPSRCCYCGRFVSFADIVVYGKAVTRQVTPDSEFTREEYETYHTACQAASGHKLRGYMGSTPWGEIDDSP